MKCCSEAGMEPVLLACGVGPWGATVVGARGDGGWSAASWWKFWAHGASLLCVWGDSAGLTGPASTADRESECPDTHEPPALHPEWPPPPG